MLVSIRGAVLKAALKNWKTKIVSKQLTKKKTMFDVYSFVSCLLTIFVFQFLSAALRTAPRIAPQFGLIQMQRYITVSDKHPLKNTGQTREFSRSKPPQKPRTWLNDNAVDLGKTFRAAYVNVAGCTTCLPDENTSPELLFSSFAVDRKNHMSHRRDENTKYIPKRPQQHKFIPKPLNPTSSMMEVWIQGSLKEWWIFLIQTLESFGEKVHGLRFR
ncbi:unnamed protein product [Arabis nemorensis]|uniref:Uncharacterized protein n=1 Tax=Arabis nemorensis TaxID=586526 RepID=A0A565ATP4_9BRAS|nr:unnamed protein product [Arabis nemorensis]